MNSREDKLFYSLKVLQTLTLVRKSVYPTLLIREDCFIEVCLSKSNFTFFYKGCKEGVLCTVDSCSQSTMLAGVL